jgi:hypothetical protein
MILRKKPIKGQTSLMTDPIMRGISTGNYNQLYMPDNQGQSVYDKYSKLLGLDGISGNTGFAFGNNGYQPEGQANQGQKIKNVFNKDIGNTGFTYGDAANTAAGIAEVGLDALGDNSDNKLYEGVDSLGLNKFTEPTTGNKVSNYGTEIGKGLLSGAASGFAAGNVPGAIIGSVIGLTKGIFGGAKKTKEQKERAEQYKQDFNNKFGSYKRQLDTARSQALLRKKGGSLGK